MKRQRGPESYLVERGETCSSCFCFTWLLGRGTRGWGASGRKEVDEARYSGISSSLFVRLFVCSVSSFQFLVFLFCVCVMLFFHNDLVTDITVKPIYWQGMPASATLLLSETRGPCLLYSICSFSRDMVFLKLYSRCPKICFKTRSEYLAEQP